MKDYYEKNKEEFLIPPSINIEYIHLPYPSEITEEQRTAATEKMKQIVMDLNGGVLLEEVSKKYDLPIQESGFFSKEQPDLTLGWSYELLQKVFELNEGQMSPPIETTKGYYLLRVKEKRDAYVPDFNDALPRVMEVLKNTKAKEKARAQAQKDLERFKEALSTDLTQDAVTVAKTLGLPVQEPVSFKRGQYIQGIGVSKEFQDTAFALSKENPISDVIEITKGFCFLHLEEFIGIDQQKYLEEKDAFAETLLEKKKNEVFTDFLSRLRASANLENNLEKPSDFPING